MNCPQCKAELETIAYEGIQIETCPSCHGEWLDDSELGHVVRTREKRFTEDERRAVAAAKRITGIKPKDVDRDLICPKCGGTTDAIHYGTDSGIVIDRCTSCRGIWLDGGELERVQALVEHWEDGLEGDLAKHGDRLRRIADEVEQRSTVNVSRFAFMNAIINGILDIA